MSITFDLPAAVEQQLRRDVTNLDVLAKEAALVECDLPPLNGTASRERIWGWRKPREATNATLKEGLAEQITPVLREDEVEVGRGKTVSEAVKMIGVTEQT